MQWLWSEKVNDAKIVGKAAFVSMVEGEETSPIVEKVVFVSTVDEENFTNIN